MTIRRRLMVTLWLVVSISVGLCLLLVLTTLQANRDLTETAEARRVAQAALTVALQAPEHFGHGSTAPEVHQAWFARLSANIASLKPSLPDSDFYTLATAAEGVDAAYRRGSDGSAATQTLVTAAAEVARRADAQLSVRQEQAKRTAENVVVLACIGSCSLFLLAFILGTRFHRAVVVPLRELVDAATATPHRLHDVSEASGELGVLARSLKRMATLVETHQRELVRAERLAAIGRLAAGVAHEINNPIAVIRGYVKTMLNEARDPELEEELKILDEEAAACARIVDDLLAFSRIPQLELDECNIGDLVETTIRRLDVAVEVEAEPATAVVDPVRIQQLLTNLVRNASQAAPGTVRVEGTTSDASYVIRVMDRGPGVPEADQERIFEPFFTKRPQGTGLGLAIVRSIVEAHQGSVRCADREGGGTTITVELPMIKESP